MLDLMPDRMKLEELSDSIVFIYRNTTGGRKNRSFIDADKESPDPL